MGEGPGHLDAANAKDRVCIKHKVIGALTASFSIGVITSTIDLLSGNAQVRGGVGGTYRSLMRDDLCEV